MQVYFWVFIGGGFGSICRYGIAHWLSRYHLAFPWATLLANVLACLILGFLTGLTFQGQLSHANVRLMLMTGFCGGFSTFSTFSNENFLLLQSGQYGAAALNMALSLIVCLVGIYVGVRLAT